MNVLIVKYQVNTFCQFGNASARASLRDGIDTPKVERSVMQQGTSNNLMVKKLPRKKKDKFDIAYSTIRT